MEEQLIQISKEIIELAQDQDCCNSVLGMMLSSAECLSLKFGKKQSEKKMFNGYNVFGSGDTKNEESLKTQLRIQTKLFRNNYYYMMQTKGKYNFPENFPPETIVKILNIWKENVSDEKQIFYNNIIKIINCNALELKYPCQNFDNIPRGNGVDQNLILNVMVPIMSHVDKGLEKVRKETELTGKIKNKLKYNQHQYDDKGLENHIKNNCDNESNRNSEEINNIIQKIQSCLSSGESLYCLDENLVKSKENYDKILKDFDSLLNELNTLFLNFKKKNGDCKVITKFIVKNYDTVRSFLNTNSKKKKSLFEKFIEVLNSNYQ